jgi:hypothetical protein
MRLHHFTSARHLSGIARHGLTVGDVPTNIFKNLGRVGVWFTSNDTAQGHGLEGSAADKKRFRLSVEIDDNARALHRWTDWARSNVDPKTLDALHSSPDNLSSTGLGSCTSAASRPS